MKKIRKVAVAALSISMIASAITPATASGSTITAPVNTEACPAEAPVLLNGSFEQFSNPATDSTVAYGPHNVYRYGLWHGYAGGPDQILFLKPSATPATGETANYITGWRSTSQMIEIQRQVGDYTEYHNNSGTLFTAASRSGTATATTAAANPGTYYDLFGGQAGAGTYWAELNAIENSALYQDITVPANAQIFWSLLNRGRTNTNEEMKVSIGLASGTLTQQTDLIKFAPTNANKFSGRPTFSSSYTSTSTIIGNLNDGWTKYAGTFPADSGATPGTSRTLRFQFGAIRGGNGWDSFGNLLDDIKFTPFLACPATRSLTVGETETVDVSNLSYGIDQTLQIIGNASASASQFSKSGDRISFTPTRAGTYTVDYQMAMDFAGETYTTASRITYNVTGTSDSGELASTGTATWAQTLGGIALVVTGALLLAFRRRTAIDN